MAVKLTKLCQTWGSSPYDHAIIQQDVEYMHNYSLPWVGCPWTNQQNVQLWADAMTHSREAYGAKSTAKGMMCTNWGGGRIEAGLAPMARKAWNLNDRS